MVWIHPQQLLIELKNFKSIYILIGNDTCLLQDNYLTILNKIKESQCYEHIDFNIHTSFNWEQIFFEVKTPSIFKKKILSLKLIQNYSVSNFIKKISLLSTFMHKDIILILYIYTPIKIKNKSFLPEFQISSVFINCDILEHTQLISWINDQCNLLKINIEPLACQLLCYYYEGNLISLKQTLNHLSLIYSDGNLNFERVKKLITDAAYFTSNHWIEAILKRNKQRSDRILQKLISTNFNLEILFKKIKHEILIITKVKYALIKNYSIHTLLKKYKINDKYHYMLLYQIIKKIHIDQLYQAISLLIEMELHFKIHHIDLSQSNFELLSTILCYSE